MHRRWRPRPPASPGNRPAGWWGWGAAVLLIAAGACGAPVEPPEAAAGRYVGQAEPVGADRTAFSWLVITIAADTLTLAPDGELERRQVLRFDVAGQAPQAFARVLPGRFEVRGDQIVLRYRCTTSSLDEHIVCPSSQRGTWTPGTFTFIEQLGAQFYRVTFRQAAGDAGGGLIAPGSFLK